MQTIVVGVDGSDAARRALQWAADEARLRGDRLVVASVFEYRSPSPALTSVPAIGGATGLAQDAAGFEEESAVSYAHQERRTRRLVTDELDHVPGGVDDLEVEIEVVAMRDPRTVLVDLSTGADLLVVGSRGLGGLKGMLLGSVSSYCVKHAHCPVTVVRTT